MQPDYVVTKLFVIARFKTCEASLPYCDAKNGKAQLSPLSTPDCHETQCTAVNCIQCSKHLVEVLSLLDWPGASLFFLAKQGHLGLPTRQGQLV